MEPNETTTQEEIKTSIVPDEKQEEQKTEDILYTAKDELVGDDLKAEDKASDGDKVEVEDQNKPDESIEIEYKLQLSDDTQLSKSIIDEVETFAKDNNLSNEAASEVLNSYEKTITDYVERRELKAEEIKDGWRDQVINDESMGGANLPKTVENAKRFVNEYANDEFITMLRESGYGDHPEVVRFFAKAGMAMQDDSMVKTKTTNASRPIEELFYGS